jgi:protein AroM
MRVGTLTIGQSPRNDIIPDLKEILGKEAKLIEKGALDGLSGEEIKELYPKPSDFPLITRMKDGREAKVGKKYIIPRMKECIRELEEAEVELIILLCGGEFPEISSKKLILKPAKILESILKGMLEKGVLAIVVPSQDQISFMKEKWERAGLNIIVESLSPYSTKENQIKVLANKLKEEKPDLIFLNCFGFDRKTKELFREITHKPVLLPRTLIGRIAKEIIE